MKSNIFSIQLKMIIIFLLLIVYSFNAGLQSAESVSVYPIRLPQTGQTRCYNSSRVVIPCTGSGQDGELRRGIAWPRPRFVVHRNGTITDRLTGLMWERIPSSIKMNWYDAFKRIKDLNIGKLGGYSDWRLPNINELTSLIHFAQHNQAKYLNGQGFINIEKMAFYWSSTTKPNDNGQAFSVSYSAGEVLSIFKTEAGNSLGGNASYDYRAIAVRNGGVGFIQIPKIGQTIEYHENDDGNLKNGVNFPELRFIDNGNGTITDTLTGLIWEKNPYKKELQWENVKKRIIEINKQKLGGFSDWKLPNINEIRSLSNYGFELYYVLKEWGFKITEGARFWTSTTTAINIVWSFWISDGSFGVIDMNNAGLHIIAVRGGR